jgi:predicted nucleotidyltransferase component of viral defense system
MVEITLDEKMLMPVAERTVYHGYGEPLQARLRVYSLEEIVAEKLRAILEHVEALEKRGWARSRARDYYDLWRILGTAEGRMDSADFPNLLRQKCRIRGVTFQGVESFFPEALLQHVGKTWKSGLGPLVAELPPYETVIAQLRPLVSTLLTSSKKT